MRNLYKIVIATIVACSTLPITQAFAQADSPMYLMDEERTSVAYDEKTDDGVMVHMEADVPSDFRKRIDLYFNDIPRSLRYDENPEICYKIDVPIADGVYELRVMSKEDFTDEYSYTVSPSIIDTSKEQEVKVTVKPTAVHTAIEEDEEVHDQHTDETARVIDPEEIDLSEGKPSGVLHIEMVPEPALTNATYTLTDGKEFYNITLHSDHAFMANVKLPIGDYYELRNIDFELDKDAVWNDEINVSWSHKKSRGSYGKYYHINENTYTELADLELMMIDGGDVYPFNSQMLFEPTLRKRKNEMIESHAESVMESAFGETVTESETETESETIAELQPVEDTSNDNWKVILGIVGVSLLGLASVVVYKKRKG